jgi:hypothetical protein
MYDALNILQSLVTKTATFNSTGFDLKTGTPRRGMKARFIVSAYNAATAGPVFTPKIQESDDNTTFTDVGATVPFTAGTAAATKEVFVSFDTSKRYIRSVMDISGTAQVPSISYLVDLGIARP